MSITQSPTPACSAPNLRGAVRSVWTAQAQLGEGTLWSVREQALYWVDILGHQLHRYSPAHQTRDSWSFDEEVSAVAERAQDAGLLLTLRHDFALFDPSTRRLQRLHRIEPVQSGNRFNDGKCDARAASGRAPWTLPAQHPRALCTATGGATGAPVCTATLR